MNDRSRRNLLPDHQSQLLQISNNQDYNLERFSSLSSLSMPLPQPRSPQFPDKAATPQGGQHYSMNTLPGNGITVLAKQEGGSAFLQNTLMQGSQEDINVIFLEMKTDLCSLMLHKFGNLAVQKLIDVVDGDRLDQILDLLTIDHNRFGHVCTDQHGSKVVKKLVERLKLMPRKQSTLASALSNTALSLTMSVYGSSSIYQCLKNFSPQFKQQLLRAIADNCLVIGRNLIGSCFLRQCFAEADDEIFDSLAPAIVQNADTLSKSRHGNYVVQRIIEMKKLEINRDITTKLVGKFIRLSMNQQGCHVVQKLMKDSGLEEVVDTVLTDILDSSSPLQVCQERYGNYVVQAAITRIKEGLLFDRLRAFIEDNKTRLRKKGHGKWVWDAMNARLRAMKENQYPRYQQCVNDL